MPKALMIGTNVLALTATFEGTKSVNVPFINSEGKQVAFLRKPVIPGWTLEVPGVGQPQFSFVRSGGAYVSVTVKFQNPYTGSVDFSIQEA